MPRPKRPRPGYSLIEIARPRQSWCAVKKEAHAVAGACLVTAGFHASLSDPQGLKGYIQTGGRRQKKIELSPLPSLPFLRGDFHEQ